MMAFGAITENNPDLLLYVMANFVQCTPSTSYSRDTMSILLIPLMAILCIGQVYKAILKIGCSYCTFMRYVDPNVVSKMLREPLTHTAISKADFSLMEMLLKHPAINLQLTRLS